MLKFIHKSILLAGLCSLPLFLRAQEPAPAATAPADTALQKSADEIIGFTYIPEELRFGLDLSRLISTAVNPGSRFAELNADLRFGRYYLAADFGAGSRERLADGLQYSSSGSYFRIGPDVNFVPGDEDRNSLILGLRYGRSWYNERLETAYEEPRWAPLPVSVSRQTGAGWFEAVAGMKAMVWNNFYLGYTLRFKFLLMTQDRSNFTSYEVPGFGRVGEGTAFAFNYHLMYRIPFKKP